KTQRISKNTTRPRIAFINLPLIVLFEAEIYRAGPSVSSPQCCRHPCSHRILTYLADIFIHGTWRRRNPAHQDLALSQCRLREMKMGEPISGSHISDGSLPFAGGESPGKLNAWFLNAVRD